MKKKTDGMTMVEVIVAFAVLMIGLAGIYKVTLLSGNMTIKASEIQAQVDDLMNKYYEDKLTDATLAAGAIEITEQDKDDTSKTGEKLGTFQSVIKDAENEEGYHIYYFEDPEEGGD